MPGNRKNNRNPFYFYMQKYKENLESRGIRLSGGFRALANAASPSWNKLSTEERRPYEKAAEEWKKNGSSDANKYTSQGTSYAEINRIQKEKREQEAAMILEIESSVCELDFDALCVFPSYFIHLNYYCRTEDSYYVPCEVALVEFTFQNGVGRCYHSLLDPQSLPLGYYLDAKKKSEETHHIPLPPNNGGETDNTKIFNSIRSFLSETKPGVKFPPLFTLPILIPAVKDFLNRLTQESETSNDQVKVYPLPKLFFELRNACNRKSPFQNTDGFPVLSIAERELERDVYDFIEGIACEYHETTDAINHCSLSFVKRWCFVLASHGCEDLGIELIQGKHKPKSTVETEWLRVKNGKTTKDINKNRIQEASKQKEGTDKASVKYPVPVSSVTLTSSDDDMSEWGASARSLAPLYLPNKPSPFENVNDSSFNNDFPALGSTRVRRYKSEAGAGPSGRNTSTHSNTNLATGFSGLKLY